MSIQRWIDRARRLEAEANWRGLLYLADRAWTLRLPAIEICVLAAEAAYQQGNAVLALRWLARADQGSDPRFEAQIANLKGCALLEAGNVRRAESFFLQALEVATKRRDRAQCARAVENLARATDLKSQRATHP